MTLLSFHSDQSIKDKFTYRVKMHKDADNIIQGTGWINGKGCAVGCTLENYDHYQYPVQLGIPVWLARLEDRIFEGLSNKDAMEWPLLFLESIPVGVDLEQVKIPFLIMIVESVLTTFDHKKYPKVLNSVNTVLSALKTNKKNMDASDAAAYAYADASAYASAYAASAYADASAYASAYAASAAASAYAAAAYDAAYASTYAASTYADAAYAAAYAASAYDAADAASASAYAASDARREKYKFFSEDLIKLLKNCK